MRAGEPSLLRLLGEGFAMAGSNLVSSGLVATIVAAVCTTVLATTGQTAAQEAAVLATIDDAGTRTIVMTEAQGGPGFDLAALDRLSDLSHVESALGFGPVFDVRNESLVGGGEPVAARTVFGRPSVGLDVTVGRWPLAGEAIATAEAVQKLRLESPAGGVDLAGGGQVSVVGSFVASGPLEGIGTSVLVSPISGAADSRMTTVHVIADAPAAVEPLVEAIVEVLSPTNRLALQVETSAALAEVRQAVQGNLGRYSRRVVALALTGGMVLTAMAVFGSVTFRRRDYGRRRALGATRSTVVLLVLTQTAVATTAGVIVGSAAGSLAVHQLAGSPPPGSFVVGLAVLGVVTSLGAAVVPALVTGSRDPVRVLRVP